MVFLNFLIIARKLFLLVVMLGIDVLFLFDYIHIFFLLNIIIKFLLQIIAGKEKAKFLFSCIFRAFWLLFRNITKILEIFWYLLQRNLVTFVLLVFFAIYIQFDNILIESIVFLINTILLNIVAQFFFWNT